MLSRKKDESKDESVDQTAEISVEEKAVKPKRFGLSKKDKKTSPVEDEGVSADSESMDGGVHEVSEPTAENQKDDKKRFGFGAFTDTSEKVTSVDEEPTKSEPVKDQKGKKLGLGRKGANGSEKSAEEQQKDKLDNLCVNITKVFNQSQADTVSGDDYAKVVEFLLQHNRFDTVERISVNLRPELSRTRSHLILAKVRDRMSVNDLGTVRRILESQMLSDDLVTNGVNLSGIYRDYLDRNTKDVESIPASVESLESVFPGEDFYAQKIDRAALDKAVEYGSKDFRQCEDFKSLDVQYNRYKMVMISILTSDDLQKVYTDKFKDIVEQVDLVEDLYPIYRVLSVPGIDAFLAPASQILNDTMDDLIRRYITRTASVADINKNFDRALPEVKQRVSETYYKEVLRVMGSLRNVEDLSEDLPLIQWTYIHGQGWEKSIIDAYSNRVFDQIKDIDSAKINDMRFITTDDFRVSNRLAEIAIGPIAEGGIPFNSLYAWLEYFSKVQDSDSVVRVRSKICLQIGKGLMDSDPDMALSYFQRAGFENLGGLEVYAIMVMAKNSLKEGNTTMALKYARDATNKKAGMSSPGKALSAYIVNLGDEPSENVVRDAVATFDSEAGQLDPILTSATLDYIAMAHLAGNLPTGNLILSKLESLRCDKSRFFQAVCKAIRAIDMMMEESFKNAGKLFQESIAMAGDDDRLKVINRLGSEYCRWSTKTSGTTPGALKTICDESLRQATTRLEKWMSLYIAGVVDDRENSWNYAAQKYVKAMDFVFDKYPLKLDTARMYIKLNEYDMARKMLEGNTDNISQVMMLEIDFLTKANTRPKSQLEKMTLKTPYERAIADRLQGMSEDHNRVWGKAADKYGEAITELANSNRRRDTLLKADMYRRRAHARFLTKQTLAVVNEDYENAIDILLDHDDGSSEFRQLREEIERQKAADNAEDNVDVSVVAAATPVSNKFQTLDFHGLSVAIRGNPIGDGGNYNVFEATAQDGTRYAVRIPKKIDPYVRKTGALTKDELVRIQNEEEIWTELSSECPDKVVQLVSTSNLDYHPQLMEFADREYSEVEPSLSVRERVDAVIRLLECIQAVHDVGIVHNDIKPDNLLQVGGVWKLADFDTAFEEGHPVSNPRGTFEYMSPEQFGQGEITSKSDVWAAGVMLCHSLSRRFPFDGREVEYRENVIAGNFNRGGVSPTYLPVLDRVFSVDPEQRPTAAEFAAELRELNGSRKQEAIE